MHGRFIIALILGVSVVSLTASVSFGQNGQNQAGPIGRSLKIDIGFRVECVRKLDVPAQADGLIKEMQAEEGLTIPKDGVLFRIDNRVANAQVLVASKKLESAQKQAEQDAELRFAEASHALAQEEYQSEMKLLKQASTTVATARKKELEATKTKLSIEAAMVKRQTDQLAVGVAQAELNAAQVQLELYDVQAPWDAYVNERLKDQGAWIRAGEPVLKIHHMAEMKVSGHINLKAISELGWSINNLEGAKIQIAVPITPAYSHVAESRIDFVSSDVDDSNNIRVSARIKNEHTANSWLLRDGVPAEVIIVVE